MSRTKNTVRNIITGFINKFVLLIFPFIIRTILIKTLGAEYLGLNSLFTSILQVLNLTELGFSSAIVYSMYKPIANNDKKTVCALLNFYKKIYRIIGMVILLLGLILLPFLPKLIHGSYPSNINIYILYLIYLANTVITYLLFAYKNTLIIANQRNDIINNISTIVQTFQYVAQMIILCVLKNYYLYIIVQLFANVLNNLLVLYAAKKKYPDFVCEGDITKEEKKEIRKKVYGLMIQRICSTTRNSLDSIFISAMLGLNIVAIYNNYYSIMSAILAVIGVIITSMISSFGNSVAVESVEKNYNNMNKFNFIYMWIAGWCTICMLCLYQPFMKIWMGTEYMFPFSVVICFCLYFYQLKMGDMLSIFKDAAGTWFVGRYELIIETILNIILNFVLGKLFGVHGIIIATFLSLLFVGFTYGTYIIFKYYFVGMSMKKYYLSHLFYLVSTIIAALITYYICSLILIDGINGLIIKGSICIFVPNLIYFIIYFKTKNYKEGKEFIVNEIIKKKKLIKSKTQE